MNRFKLLAILLVFSILSSISLTNIAEPRPGEKVAVCHKGYLIEVNPNALNKHLAHGDYLPDPLFLSSAGNRFTCSVAGDPSCRNTTLKLSCQNSDVRYHDSISDIRYQSFICRNPLHQVSQ